MELNPRSEIYIPDDQPTDLAIARTTHLAIGAHQDDLEIMAIDGILACFQNPKEWFTGVVVTNGSGSPRSGVYADYSDEDMMKIRDQEQKRAAFLGEYSAQLLLRYSSAEIKARDNQELIEELAAIVKAASPEIVYTHNLADKHPTHIGVAIKTIKALRSLPPEKIPAKVYGCEVWRDLGWMLDDDKVVFDCSGQQNLQTALLGVFDSQISGGKRYDLAAMGRRISHATFFASHDTDQAQGLAFAVDLTPLIIDTELDIQEFIQAHIDRFSEDVSQLIGGVL
jgi:LmbE family N-acetylglucosaminyl deacetylase